MQEEGSGYLEGAVCVGLLGEKKYSTLETEENMGAATVLTSILYWEWEKHELEYDCKDYVGTGNPEPAQKLTEVLARDTLSISEQYHN